MTLTHTLKLKSKVLWPSGTMCVVLFLRMVQIPNKQKKINNKHKTRSLDHSSKSDLASVPTTSTIRLISVICWLSQLLWFHHSLRNVSSTHLDFIISLVLWVHEMPQTDIQEKNKSINYNQKEKKSVSLEWPYNQYHIALLPKAK